jgi:hypothetical protein
LRVSGNFTEQELLVRYSFHSLLNHFTVGKEFMHFAHSSFDEKKERIEPEHARKEFKDDEVQQVMLADMGIFVDDDIPESRMIPVFIRDKNPAQERKRAAIAGDQKYVLFNPVG